MAIYHLSAQIISRSQGRSAVACAAYRSGYKLLDTRTEKTHDYTKKQDVAFSEIMLCKNASDWMADRQTLWNRVEQNEKRKDAQLAREIQLALPRELALEQNIELAKAFVQSEFVDKGMVADLAIHLDKTTSGESQPHAHVMLTMREITAEGFGQKVRAWNSSDLLVAWRESWANLANRYLALHGFDLRIDHRSNIEQGIELEPQHKIGSAVAKERLAHLADHQRIAKENGELILKDPLVALNAITRQQSTFTHQDLARFVNRHTADAEQFQVVYDTLKGNDEIVYLGNDNKGRERFTTRDMLALEANLMNQARVLHGRLKHRVPKDTQTPVLNRYSLSAEQAQAFQHLVKPNDIHCVVGYAGTGKSYLLGAAKEAWEAQGYRVLGATLSGIAAENLAGSSGIESRTLASRFYQWDRGREHLTAKDILVVDEAGMIGSRQMAKLIDHASNQGAKVVLVGDPEQLQAIEAGAAFRAISEQVGYVSLTEIRRQREVWQQEATKALAGNDIKNAIDAYKQHDHVHEFKTNLEAKQAMVNLWQDVRMNQPEQTQIMLAYTRADVKELNEMARALRHQQGELGKDKSIQTERGERLFSEQDRIYFLKNERSLGVMNGTLGTVEKIEGHTLTVKLDDQSSHQSPQTITVDTAHYNHLDHGYAATIHKAQGVTVDRSYLLASKHLDAHATYVGLTRHRESSDIFWSREAFTLERDLGRALSRQHQKDVTLDYMGTDEALHCNKVGLSIEHGQRQDKDQEKQDVAIFSDAFSPLREAQLKQAAQAYDTLYISHQAQTQRDPLQDFKAQFEALNPTQAKQLQEAVRPAHERRALEVEQQFRTLEKEIGKAFFKDIAQNKLQAYAASISKQPEVMAYLKNYNKELTDKIQQFAKSYERSLDRGIER